MVHVQLHRTERRLTGYMPLGGSLLRLARLLCRFWLLFAYDTRFGCSIHIYQVIRVINDNFSGFVNIP